MLDLSRFDAARLTAFRAFMLPPFVQIIFEQLECVICYGHVSRLVIRHRHDREPVRRCAEQRPFNKPNSMAAAQILLFLTMDVIGPLPVLFSDPLTRGLPVGRRFSRPLFQASNRSAT